MAVFDNINSVYAPERKLTSSEILRALKLGIASEYETVQLYQQMIESTDNNEVKIILQGIAEDEMHHAGKLAKLLEILSPEETAEYNIGVRKAEQILGIKQ